MNGVAACSLVACLLGGMGLFIAATVIITRGDSSLPEGARRVDDLVSSGLLTLIARFVENWGDAQRGFKVLFVSSAVVCVAEFVGSAFIGDD